MTQMMIQYLKKMLVNLFDLTYITYNIYIRLSNFKFIENFIYIK
jgi:hypothetical protein